MTVVNKKTFIAQAQWIKENSDRKLIFTNGCFDLLHVGHISGFDQFEKEGWIFVAICSDKSVAANKGPKRPIIPQDQRAAMVNALRGVDCVTIVDEDELEDLIAQIQPDILFKGEDWSGKTIKGSTRAENTVLAPLIDDISTTKIIDRIKERYNEKG